MRSLLLVALLTGCAAPLDDSVVGPFTGTLHRFTVDHLVVPFNFYAQDDRWHTDPYAIGDDLNGDRSIDNQLAAILGTLHDGNNLTTHADDMIASGTIRSVVEVQADDLDNDPHVGVTFHGTEGDVATTMGGVFIDGSLHSNRTRSSTFLGSATAVLPIFADADPSVIQLESLEIDLTPDGSGGYNANVSGGITPASLEAATAAGIRQIFAADPHDHIQLAALVGTEHDGTFTDADLLDNGFIQSLLAPDLLSGLTSAGFAAHLSPCPTGSCITTPPADRCHDRVLDQDETDVDCGGATCMPCGSLFACQLATDCQIGACDGGHCRAATCSDGISDGTEDATDCGGLCQPCP